MKRIEKAAIIGAGALGVVYGSRMTERLGKENVFYVADQERIRRYEWEKLYCDGKCCDLRFVDGKQTSEKADLIIFAVKYTALAEAIDSVKNLVAEDTIMISLLNGVVSERDIAAVYGEDRVLYCIAQGTDAVKEGNHFSHTNEGLFQIGTASGEWNWRLQAVTEFFERAGMAYRVPEDIIHQLWNKLMLNVGVNQAVAVFETNYGGIQRPGKERDLMIEAMREVQSVAVSQGITLTDGELSEWLNVLAALAPESMPSMRQDTKARRKTEVELFSGTICRLGKEYDVPTPVNDFLYQRIREIEAGYDNV